MGSVNRLMAMRITVLLLGAIAVFGGLTLRLYYLQVIRASEMVARSERSRNVTIILPPARGQILDRNQRPLALTRWTFTVKADKTRLRDVEGAVRQVGEVLGQSEEQIQRNLALIREEGRQAVELQRNLDEEMRERIQALRLPGISFDKQDARFYPEGKLASQLIGYTGSDNIGLDGLEFSLNSILEGRPARITADADPRRRPLADIDFTKADNQGADVILTIDSYIQYVVERELEAVLERTQAKYANAVVQHAKTGEVLALANAPRFDPNHYQEYAPQLRNNRLVVDVYEPGSTLKPFTFMPALERGLITPDTMINCENGSYYFPGRSTPIRDDIQRYGIISAHRVMVRSSNIGTVKVALELGENARERAEALYAAYRAFGFKNREPCLRELPGSAGGILHPPHRWYPVDLGAIPYGQGIATNTLVLNNAYTVIANRGLYRDPHIIRGYRKNDGMFIPRDPEPFTRVFSTDATEKMVDMLVAVTEEVDGTGRRVRIPGFRIAGKTGTAQKVNPQTGTYGRGMRITTFCGFFPAEDPELVISVMVDEPTRGTYGGEVSGPVWKAIAEEIIAYWGMAPTNLDDPLLTQTTIAAAPKSGTGNAPELAFGVSQRLPYVSIPDWEQERDVMPDLVGLPLREAFVRLSRLGLRARFEGAGKVVRQEIEAGTPLDEIEEAGVIWCEPVLIDPDRPTAVELAAQR